MPDQSDSTSTESTEETTSTETDETTDTDTTDESTEGQESTDGDQSDDTESDLPEWAKKERSDLRAEAANYRTRLREVERQLADAKSPEEFDQVVTDLKTRNAELERSLLVSAVAREFKLPTDLAELLKGEDEAALKEHAKRLQKYAAQEDLDPEDLNGGLDPNGDTTPDDPRELARIAGRGRRRR